MMNPLVALPICFVAATTNLGGRAWRETGTINQPGAMARVSVASSMVGGGWTLVHDIAESEISDRRIQLWRHAATGTDAILMLWSVDPFSTGLAWGYSRPAGEEERPTGDGPLPAWSPPPRATSRFPHLDSQLSNLDSRRAAPPAAAPAADCHMPGADNFECHWSQNP